MASIVYEGVGGGGSLFKGIKFHFLHRIPSRNHWIDLVKSNSGEIVILEKQADIVIADHARKDTPVGSISWTYVDQSIKKGVLEELDDHRAGPLQHTVRAVGSGGGAKKSRTPYTAEDDRILKDWVLKGERAGLSSSGLELFKQLEERNQRHTFQSWHDRWRRIKESYGLLDTSATPDFSDGPVLPSHSDRKVGRPKRSSTSPEVGRKPVQHKQAQASASRSKEVKRSMRSLSNSHGKDPAPKSPILWVNKSAGGMEFSTKEINLLISQYDHIMNISQDKAFDAWATWAATYPNHSPSEWRNYFVYQLAPQIKEKQEVDSRNTIKQSKQSQISKSEEVRSAEKVPESTPANPDLGDDDATPQDEDQSVDPALQDERLFEDTLLDVADFLDIVEVVFDPSIRGQKISLFKLWQTVKSEFGGREEVTFRRRWPEVAKRLGFPQSQLKDAAEDLQFCYDEILTDYEATRDDFYGMTESQEQELDDRLIKKQLFPGESEGQDEAKEQQTEEEVQQNGDENVIANLDTPSKSPVLPTPKKRVPTQISQDLASIAGPASKRQRTEKGKGKEREIPSTPDHIIGIQVPQTVLRPSPLKNSLPIENLEESDDESFIKPFKQPDFLASRSRKPILEPETQDFRFETQLDENEDDIEEIPNTFDSSKSTQSLPAIDRSSEEEVPQESRQDSPRPIETAPYREETLPEFVERYISLSYPSDIVFEAMNATTMSTENASIVMEALQQGRGIPEDVPGVWTTEDDWACLDRAGPDLEKIIEKHGIDRVELRRHYLNDKREAEKQLDQSS